MRKTYVLLFLALFVAAGSMMFIGSVEHAHAICTDGAVTAGTVSTVSASVSGSTANAAVSGAAPSECSNNVYIASGWATAKLVDSSGNVVADGSCGSIDALTGTTPPTYSISCSVGLSGVPAGQYKIKANTHNIYNGGQIDGTPKSSSVFTVGTPPNASLSAENLTIPSGTATTLHWMTTNASGGQGYWESGLNGDVSPFPNGSISTGNLSATTKFQYKAYDVTGSLSDDSNLVTVNVTTAVNGSCTPGTTQNQASYSSGATGWDARQFCNGGNPAPVSPAFPSAGSTTSWQCVGTGGGTTASCSASRQTSSCTWTPSPSTVCSGVNFTQADGCGNTRTAVGTMTCNPTFTISPPSATIQVGGGQQYSGYYDPDGPGGPQASQTISASSVTWSSSNTSAATISSSGLATGVAAGSATIHGTYSGITANANLNVQGAGADFSLSVSPMTQDVTQGSSVAYVVTIAPINGFTGTVALSKSNLTTGLSGSFNPISVAGGAGTSQFTLSASASAALGASNFTITGTSGTLSHGIQPTVNVVSSSPSPSTASDTVPVEVYFCQVNDPVPGCASAPGCVISASPQNIMTGASSQLTWSCTGVPTTTPCSVSGDQGAGTIWVSSGWDGSNVSQRVRPRNTTRYTLSCAIGGGTNVSADVEVRVGFLPVLREIIPRW